jgi:hypothetical protein
MMKTSENRRAVYVGKQRMYKAFSTGKAHCWGAGLFADKLHWFNSEHARDRWLAKQAEKPLRTTRKYNVQERFVDTVCACGCGNHFMATIKTRPQLYVDDSHRNRIANIRRKEAREAFQKRLLAEQRRRRLDDRLRNIQPVKKSARSLGGERGEGKGKGGVGAMPPLPGITRGLFANTPEPEKTKRRKKVGLPTGKTK